MERATMKMFCREEHERDICFSKLNFAFFLSFLFHAVFLFILIFSKNFHTKLAVSNVFGKFSYFPVINSTSSEIHVVSPFQR